MEMKNKEECEEADSDSETVEQLENEIVEQLETENVEQLTIETVLKYHDLDVTHLLASTIGLNFNTFVFFSLISCSVIL